MIDIASLTLGEIAKVESLSQMSVNHLGDNDSPKGLLLAALAFVTKRRSDPAFLWNDAQALTIDQANAILGFDEDEPEADPTE